MKKRALRHVSHVEVFHAQAFSSSTIEQPSGYALVINLKTAKALAPGSPRPFSPALTR
jgi:hypothetical protein